MPPQKQAAHHKYTIFINEDCAPMTYSMTSSAGTNPKVSVAPKDRLPRDGNSPLQGSYNLGAAY